MSTVEERPARLLGRINAPAPPAPFSAQELVMFRRMVRERLRRAERRARRSEQQAAGSFSGMNANEVHARRLRDLDSKVVGWLAEVWPAVAQARGVEADEAGLEAWLGESLPEGSRSGGE